MTHELTTMQADDVVAVTNKFLGRETGAVLDGAQAADSVQQRLRLPTIAERADRLLRSSAVGNGFYTVLGNDDGRLIGSYDEAVAVLPGHFVLVPSNRLEAGKPRLFPAVVSEDGIATGSLRLHVLKQSYNPDPAKFSYAATLLSAAGQAETGTIGNEATTGNVGLEAEHFSALLAAGGDAQVRRAWQNGNHVNHLWRQQSDTSVTTELTSRLIDTTKPQQTITIGRQEIESGPTKLYWYDKLRGSDDRPDTASRPQALVVLQALGFQSLQQRGMVDNLKQMLAVHGD